MYSMYVGTIVYMCIILLYVPTTHHRIAVYVHEDAINNTNYVNYPFSSRVPTARMTKIIFIRDIIHILALFIFIS